VSLTSNSYILPPIISDERLFRIDISKYTEFIGLLRVDGSKKEKLIIFAYWLKYMVLEPRRAPFSQPQLPGQLDAPKTNQTYPSPARQRQVKQHTSCFHQLSAKVTES